jgi:hypothetical protein
MPQKICMDGTKNFVMEIPAAFFAVPREVQMP